MQDASTHQLIFGVSALIEMISIAMSLEPADVIITGTPGGVGAARKPPVFMQSGDLFEVEIEGMGVLRVHPNGPVWAGKSRTNRY
jgi:acylpyruvate hydrolase